MLLQSVLALSPALLSVGPLQAPQATTSHPRATSHLRAASHLRVPHAPLLQQSPRDASPLYEVSSEQEIDELLKKAPALSVTLVMLLMRGDAKAAKVRRFFLDKCADNEMLQRLIWECDADDAAAAALSTLGAAADTPTPYFVGLDTSGGKVLDFVALTPSALFYGLEDLGGVLDAIEQEEKAAVPSSGGGGSEGEGSGSSVSEERVAALEAEVLDLRMQVSKQQVEVRMCVCGCAHASLRASHASAVLPCGCPARLHATHLKRWTQSASHTLLLRQYMSLFSLSLSFAFFCFRSVRCLSLVHCTQLFGANRQLSSLVERVAALEAAAEESG